MPIIDLKKIKEYRNIKLSHFVNIAFVFLVFAAIITYYGNNIAGMNGVTLLIGSLFFMEFKVLQTFHREIFKEPGRIVLMKIIIILMIFFVILIEMTSSLPRNFLPIGSAAILLTILINPFVAALNVFVISVFASVIQDFSLGYFFIALAGGIAGVYSSRNVRNRKDLNKCGLVILIVNVVMVSAVGLIKGLGILDFSVGLIWAALNALVSVVIASGILPIFEGLFGITTNIRLLEIGDFNHPLLKRLMLEAPGTYHHSLMVANLAENACEKIGANSLLARIGAYYHDIGKLRNPQYFIENHIHMSDKHKNLKPNISAIILKRHVKDGLALADENKLDRVITDMIQQHHGVTLIEFFYKKVLEESKGDKNVDEKEFRYPGPRPQTKEAGVLMLADSVEAACRTLDEPTFSRISGLVRKIITGKFIDLQLNNCDITLANLEEIQKSFTNTLASIYHSRIEYPEDKEEKSVESKN